MENLILKSAIFQLHIFYLEIQKSVLLSGRIRFDVIISDNFIINFFLFNSLLGMYFFVYLKCICIEIALTWYYWYSFKIKFIAQIYRIRKSLLIEKCFFFCFISLKRTTKAKNMNKKNDLKSKVLCIAKNVCNTFFFQNKHAFVLCTLLSIVYLFNFRLIHTFC